MLRIGPICSMPSWLWKIPINRVMPPSANTSYTISAWLSPDCGLAAGALLIITASGRCVTGASTASPVKGALYGAGAAGSFTSSTGGCTGLCTSGLSTGSACGFPPQADNARTAAIAMKLVLHANLPSRCLLRISFPPMDSPKYLLPEISNRQFNFNLHLIINAALCL